MPKNNQRTSVVETSTKETKIRIRVNLDGSGKSSVSTGTRFLDHMITGLSTHSLIDIEINARGDLRHHIIEDTAIALGKCLSKALGDRMGIARFGFVYVPMDEALAFASIDLVRRTFFVSSGLTETIKRNSIEDLPKEDLEHFFRSLCDSLQCTLHMRLEYGSNDHHKVEASFKALALALRQAVSLDTRRKDRVPSSKGKM
ncbi:MAG: imidazoleglycerol-phosphate dehydratase [Nitrososphaerales archaeon]